LQVVSRRLTDYRLYVYASRTYLDAAQAHAAVGNAGSANRPKKLVVCPQCYTFAKPETTLAMSRK
jgi:hypothetical protein